MPLGSSLVPVDTLNSAQTFKARYQRTLACAFAHVHSSARWAERTVRVFSTEIRSRGVPLSFHAFAPLEALAGV
jgi:hypothetical protein